MIKTVGRLVSPLESSATYDQYKAWESAVGDWVFSHTSIAPCDLGPTSVRSVARMTMKPELYTLLDNAGAMGSRAGNRGQADWKAMSEHLQDKLGCNSAHLKIGLSLLKQGDRDMVTFAQEFERRARDAEYDEDGAKALLISNLNPTTLFRLDNFVSN